MVLPSLFLIVSFHISKLTSPFALIRSVLGTPNIFLKLRGIFKSDLSIDPLTTFMLYEVDRPALEGFEGNVRTCMSIDFIIF